MDRTGAPANTWLLALMYVCFILNVTSVASLNYKTPYQVLHGQTPDISEIFQFEFWEPVYFATGEQLDSINKPSFPSTTHEKAGRFVGFAETVGDKFCYKVLTDDTQKIIYRSAIRSARDTVEVNRRASPPVGEPVTEFVKSSHTNGDPTTPRQICGQSFDPEDLIGRSYLMDPEKNGERFRAKIIEKIIERENDVEEGLNNIGKTKFLVSIEGSKQPKQIVDYNVILDHINKQMDDNPDPSEVYWKFKRIVSHQGPLQSSHPDYKGSLYNVMLEWEDGQFTYEPLKMIGADDPVTCALYAKQNNLLDAPGWKQFRGIAKNDKKMLRMLNQSKLRSYRTAKVYKNGFEVPKNPLDAIRIDTENRNRRWQDSMALELSQIQEYKTFRDLGKHAPGPAGYKKIQVHFVFDVKHDGRHKSRLVAGGILLMHRLTVYTQE